MGLEAPEFESWAGDFYFKICWQMPDDDLAGKGLKMSEVAREQKQAMESAIFDSNYKKGPGVLG